VAPRSTSSTSSVPTSRSAVDSPASAMLFPSPGSPTRIRQRVSRFCASVTRSGLYAPPNGSSGSGRNPSPTRARLASGGAQKRGTTIDTAQPDDRQSRRDRQSGRAMVTPHNHRQCSRGVPAAHLRHAGRTDHPVARAPLACRRPRRAGTPLDLDPARRKLDVAVSEIGDELITERVEPHTGLRPPPALVRAVRRRSPSPPGLRGDAYAGLRRRGTRRVGPVCHDDVVAGLGGRLITKASLHRVLRDDFVSDCRADCRASLSHERKPRDLRGFLRYRYGDSNPGFRRERAAS
jgi:hypothetical protein